ncbi:MAG: ABC transporter ATP-binding protein, partial [Chloroflexota bacterium]|nr:ABC transporter ATP-binding protein [Chloroflexota bacterium]
GREEMLDLIVRIHRLLGIAVVVSSHILEDIERVCSYVVILDDGRLVAAQSITDIGAGGGDLILRIDGDTAAFVGRLASLGVEARPAGADYGRDEFVVTKTDDRVFDAVRDAAADLGLPLRSLRTRARSLEDLYFGRVDANGGGSDQRGAGHGRG